MRLFVAVDLPEAVKASLDTAVAPLRAALPAARWVRPNQFHLTLAFLGETDADRLPALSSALREKLEQEGGFRAHFGALGAFPKAGPVRVLWVGLEPSVRFVRLAELVQDALRAAGIGADDKPFRSHVTLARCEPVWPPRLRSDLGAAAEDLAGRLAGLSFACDRVTLFASVLGPGGPVYKIEDALPLQAP